MNGKILVAGATGDLGHRIVKALRQRNAEVLALVRHSSDAGKIEELENLGVQVIKADTNSVDEVAKACIGVACVVSALAGLADVIVDAQTVLLEGAVKAGVPRFIPSDYSTDFTHLPEGENRNFDLRKTFHKKLEGKAIKATSIMNGAFAEVLAYNTPLYNLKNNTIGYWGDDPGYKIDFTTKDDVAAFTAAAAMDGDTPRLLHIASFQISPQELAAKASTIKGKEFTLVPMGSLESLSAYNKAQRAAHPEGEKELYPSWQGSQYMHSMFSLQNKQLDNDRYPGLKWTTAEAVLEKI